jgi:hypothetical protein
MNPYGYLALLIALGGALGWGTWERGSYEKSQADLANLKASYAQASAKAVSDAQKLTIQRYTEIRDQGFRAAAAQQIRADQLQTQLTSYRSTLAKLSQEKNLDPAHACAALAVPADILDGLQPSPGH